MTDLEEFVEYLEWVVARGGVAVAESVEIDECGGEGGKPGPCATGEKTPAKKGKAKAAPAPAPAPAPVVAPQDAFDAVTTHARERHFDMPTPDLYAKMKEKHPALTPDDYKRQVVELHHKGVIRLSMWAGPTDNIPNKELAIPAPMVTGHANQMPGRIDYFYYARPGQSVAGFGEAVESHVTECDSPTALLPVPDVAQSYPYDCGAAAVQSVARYYSVGPDTEEEYIKALGTTEADGTAPAAIVQYLQSLGLSCAAREGMTLDDLAAAFAAGVPVIVAIQDWCEPGELDAEQCGHYVCVIGAWSGFIFVQDPSEASVMTDQGGAGADGKVAIPAREFLARWKDVNTDGSPLVRWGCAVSKGEGA